MGYSWDDCVLNQRLLHEPELRPVTSIVRASWMSIMFIGVFLSEDQGDAYVTHDSGRLMNLATGAVRRDRR